MMKGNPDKISGPAAEKALKLAGGDKKAAYSQYIKLFFEQTGQLNCGASNDDLQAYYKLNKED